MHIILLIIAALVVVIAFLALLPVPRWVSWLVPIGWGLWAGSEWIDEIRAEGDTQQGLVFVVGLGVLLVLVCATLLAARVARRVR